MQIQEISVQKRFCEANTELLRVLLRFPKLETADIASDVFDSFYREIAEDSLMFAENQLFRLLQSAYAALSTHEKKFCVQKYIYSVCAEASVLPENVIKVDLSATLRQKGAVLFQSEEHQKWEVRNASFAMVPI